MKDISVQLDDLKKGLASLKKRGISAEINPAVNDEIMITLTNKKEVISWFIKDLKWTEDNIETIYPELYEENEFDIDKFTEILKTI